MNIDKYRNKTCNPLMVGPIRAISGQGEAFRQSCKAIPRCIVVDSEFMTPWSLVTYPLRLTLGFFKTNKAVYFTSSRSLKGFYSRDIWVFFLGIMLRRRIINHLHGADFEMFYENSGLISRMLIDSLYKKIDVSIAPAEYVLKQYHRYTKMRLEVVENFFDLHQLTVIQYRDYSAPLELIYLSNLIFSKGFTVSVEACKLLYNEGLDLHLTLCGVPLADEFMSVDEINDYIASIQDLSFVTYYGPVHGETKTRLLDASDVMLLPTSKDLSPISIIEGLSRGCYVITTDQGAIPSLLDGFHGSILEPSAEGVAASIRMYKGMEPITKRRISYENRMLANERFAAERYRKEIITIIEDACL